MMYIIFGAIAGYALSGAWDEVKKNNKVHTIAYLFLFLICIGVLAFEFFV